MSAWWGREPTGRGLAIPCQAQVPGILPSYTWAHRIGTTTLGKAELHLVLQRLSPTVGQVSHPAVKQRQRCSHLSRARHFLRHPRIVPIFQTATLVLSLDDVRGSRFKVLGHGSGAGVSAYLHSSSGAPGLGEAPFPVWNLHARLPKGHCLRQWKGRGRCGAAAVALCKR